MIAMIATIFNIQLQLPWKPIPEIRPIGAEALVLEVQPASEISIFDKEGKPPVSVELNQHGADLHVWLPGYDEIVLRNYFAGVAEGTLVPIGIVGQELRLVHGNGDLPVSDSSGDPVEPVSQDFYDNLEKGTAFPEDKELRSVSGLDGADDAAAGYGGGAGDADLGFSLMRLSQVQYISFDSPDVPEPSDVSSGGGGGTEGASSDATDPLPENAPERIQITPGNIPEPQFLPDFAAPAPPAPALSAPANRPPLAADDSVTISEDSPLTGFNILSNDGDPDGDPVTLVGTPQASNGVVTVNPDGTINYTPNPDFHGVETISYTIADPSGLTSVATITITVEPVNDPPEASDDSVSVDEDNPITIPVVSNDIDIDDDSLTVTAVADPPNGTATINPDGTVNYVPDPDFTGTDTFTYTISDGNGGTDTASITVTVDPVNDPPEASDDNPTTNEDTPLTIDAAANDSDIDGDLLTVTAVADPPNGTATINPDGTVNYVPDPDFTGTDTFTYTISDGNGGTDTATITVTVDPVNDPPDAIDDNPTTNEDTPLTIDAAANDSDIDGDLLTVTAVADPPNGTATINPDGTVNYVPDPDFTGTDTFTYTISDGNGGTDTAAITVTVDPVNDPPDAIDDNPTTNEDTPLTIDAAANDSDIDGDSLTVTAVADPPNGTATINPDGTVNYVPDPDFTGTDTFTYTISDGNGGTDTASITVTVDPVNDPPEASDDSSTTNEDTPLTIDAAANDSDIDGDSLTVTAVADPPNGTATINPDGTVNYVPDPDFTGTDTFTYTISDGNGGTDTASITVTVDPVNDPPDAIDDNPTTNEDTPLTIDAAANDSDIDGDLLTVTAVADPPNGTATINPDGTVNYVPDPDFTGTDTFTYTISDGNGGTDTASITVTVDPVNDPPEASDDNPTTNEDTPLTIDAAANDSDIDGDLLTVTAVADPPNGTATINPDGTVNYVPDPDFTGTDTFTYTISDGNGGTDTATITVTVDPVNDPPDAIDDNPTTNEDTPLTIDAAANDSDIDGDLLTVTAVADPPNGTATINPDGTVNYVPDPDFTGTDTFTYTISDGNGGTDTATITVTVDPVNDPPDAIDDNPTTNEDTPLTIDAAANDSDIDGDLLTVTAVADPPNGTATINPDGTVNYVPDPDFTGTDTFTYTISDGNGGTDTAAITVTVDPVNDPPDAIDDNPTTNEDTPLTIDAAANDSDIDGDSLTVTAVADPPNGTATINPDGTVNYVPDPDFTGTDTFTYTISDGNGGTDTASITVTVDPVNDPPEASDDSSTTNEDTPLTIDAAANDSDIDGDLLTVTAVADPPNGTATINPDGTVNYVPDPDFTGTDTFSYTISDGNGGTDTASITVTVDPVNDPPEASDDSSTTNEDTPLTIDAAANDSDIDGDSLTVTAVADPPNGTATINPDGTVNYVPDPDFTGTDTFTYTISDGNGGTDTATITVTVDPVNDLPQAQSDSASIIETGGSNTGETSVASGNVLSNDVDIDGDTLTVSNVSFAGMPFQAINPGGSVAGPTQIDGAYGILTVQPDGSYSYMLDDATVDPFLPSDTASEVFTYTMDDGNGETSLSTLQIDITGANDAPVITAHQLDTSVYQSSVSYTIIGAIGSPGATTWTYQLEDDTGNYVADVRLTVLSGSGEMKTNPQHMVFLDDDGSTVVRYDIFEPGTTTPKALDLPLKVSDLDGGDADETMTVTASELAAYGTGPEVAIEDNGDGTLTFRGTGGGREDGAANVWLNDVQTFQISYGADEDGRWFFQDFSVAPTIDFKVLDSMDFNVSDVDHSAAELTWDMSSVSGGQFEFVNDPGTTITSFTHQQLLDGEVGFRWNEVSSSISYNATVTDALGESDAVSSGTLNVTPIVLDLDGDGVEIDSIDQGIAFDVDGDGALERVAWADEDDAVLVYDHNQDGQITDRSEVVFSDYIDEASTDLEGLRYFDSNDDFALSSEDSEWTRFGLWQDANGNGVTDPGELASLEEAGVESISLISDGLEYFTAEGDALVYGHAQVQFIDGSSTVAADAEFDYEELIDESEVDCREVETGEQETLDSRQCDTLSLYEAVLECVDLSGDEEFCQVAGYDLFYGGAGAGDHHTAAEPAEAPSSYPDPIDAVYWSEDQAIDPDDLPEPGDEPVVVMTDTGESLILDESEAQQAADSSLAAEAAAIAVEPASFTEAAALAPPVAQPTIEDEAAATAAAMG